MDDDDLFAPSQELTNEYLRVPENVRPPDEAYRFFPPENETILTIGSHTQRLIFEGGQKFKDYEWDHIRTFEAYIEDEKVQLSPAAKEIYDEPRYATSNLDLSPYTHAELCL